MPVATLAGSLFREFALTLTIAVVVSAIVSLTLTPMMCSRILRGEARARVTRPLPWTETFDSYADGYVPPGWINAVAGKFSVTTLDGQKVLQKAPDSTIFKRLRAFIARKGS